MMLGVLKSVIKYNKYVFKSVYEKKKLLENNNISVSEFIAIIKTLPKSIKKDELKKVFINIESISIPFNDIVKIFKCLSYEDRIYIIQNTPFNDYLKELIKTMPEREKYNALKYEYLETNIMRYIINILTESERNKLYNSPLLLNNSVKVELLRYFSEDKILNVLNNKKGLINRLTSDEKVQLITYLKDDDIKLEYLSNNNSHFVISHHNEMSIISSLSDNVKLKFIENDSFCNLKLDFNEKTTLVHSLSDESKLYFLNHPEKLNCCYYSGKNNFFGTFSGDYAKIILENRLSYAYKIDNNDMMFLINKLNLEEKLTFLKKENDYGIKLNNNEKCSIVCNLPSKTIIKIIKNQKLYDFPFDQNNLNKILKSMNAMNAINILTSDDCNYFNLTKENICDIVESMRYDDDVITILNSTNPLIREFVLKFKTSFVKCLNSKEKMDVIYNRSIYNIYLEDYRKIKILKSISCYANLKQYLDNNVFDYFEDPKTICNQLIDKKSDFNQLNELFKIQLLAKFMNVSINYDDITLGLDIVNCIPNALVILNNYKLLRKTFIKLNINIYDFFQYGINSNKYSWYNDILKILNDDKLSEFIQVKNYFFNNYYNSFNDSKYIISNFLELLSMYNKYELFCVNMAKWNKKLSKDEQDDIRFLFNDGNTYDVKEIRDISLIREEKIKSYVNIAVNSVDYYELKNALILLLFNKSFSEMEEFIKYTGGTVELKILEFNNKNNFLIKKMVDDLILLTSFIEQIINTNDFMELKKMILFYCDDKNIIHTKKIANYCSKYEEFNRQLYEYDLQSSLTNISGVNNELFSTKIAKDFTKKYGCTAIDLTKSQYVLGAHVKSYREEMDDLVSGNSDGKSNFICLSPISHRGQHYYTYGDSKIILAYDEIPKNSFICSSISNMCTNSSLKYNCSEVPTVRRTQRNILETSEAPKGNNAEILCYRSGLKPCGLILPLNTEPSKEAIEYNRKYKLPFILTQDLDTRINNPLPITTKKCEMIDISEINDIDTLKELKENLIIKNHHEKRRIAVLADPHALYEPTLACLVDMKNKGIDEIYSLGDNIGHGPNPSEVLSLLKEYGVKSIYGNHELYLREENGILEFSDHFPSEESRERTELMTEWMKHELTEYELDIIKGYPEKYEIDIPNGKKITLIHTTSPYTKIGKFSKKPEINKDSYVIKGHDHFESENSQELTLRAVGIGQTSKDDGKATYAIIEIDNNDYSIIKVNVDYDRSNLLHTINESNMPESAKDLISNWVKHKAI